MTIWQVWSDDYDWQYVMATYSTRERAEAFMSAQQAIDSKHEHDGDYRIREVVLDAEQIPSCDVGCESCARAEAARRERNKPRPIGWMTTTGSDGSTSSVPLYESDLEPYRIKA